MGSREEQMRRKGHTKRHVKKETGHRHLHKKKTLHPNNHNFYPGEGKGDHTNADGQTMYVHNAARL